MIRRLQIRIVMLIMLVSAVLLSIAAGAFYSATARGLQQDSESLLQRAAEGIPSISPFYDDDQGVQLPFFVVLADESGRVIETQGGYFTLTDRQQLQNAVTASLTQKNALGELEHYSLRYFRIREEQGWRVAFADLSFERSTLQQLLRNLFILCLCGLILIFFLAVLAAHLAVRPISKAMLLQQQFLSDASHELKTPLTVILSNVQLLAQQLDIPEQQRQLSFVQAEARQMQGLVQELLELGRAESHSVLQPRQTVNLSALVAENLLCFEATAFEAGRSLDGLFEPDLNISGDKATLGRLLGIFLDNGIKYAPKHTTIYLHLYRKGRYAVLTVSNPAEDMTQEQVKLLFHRFYRGDSARSDSGSYGLGLAIAQSIVLQHHGRLTAELKNGQLRFIAQFPLAQKRKKCAPGLP